MSTSGVARGRGRSPIGRGLGRRLVVGATGLGIAAALLLGAGSTSASWNDSEYARATLTTAVVPRPGALTCTGAGSTVVGNVPPTVTFSWAAPSPPTTAIAQYSWTLTGTSGLAASGTVPSTATGVPIAGDVVPAGTYTFAVVARGTGTWVSAANRTGTYTRVNAVLGFLLASSSCTVVS
jgi:predicted ribosomally synthesized peptide with SipW-like signal peptide